MIGDFAKKINFARRFAKTRKIFFENP